MFLKLLEWLKKYYKTEIDIGTYQGFNEARDHHVRCS
jgi:hypothetical protein